MKIIEKLTLLLIIFLIIYGLNYCLPLYNNMLEGMCNNIALCDFKPLYSSDDTTSTSTRPMRSKGHVDPTTSLYPDSTIKDNVIPTWPKPCKGASNKNTKSNNLHDNVPDNVPADVWTHPPTNESIRPFKVKKPPAVNQPYQQLFVADEFTINYPCHPSITGAFTTCGPSGFGGFCPASNNYSVGGI